MRGFSLWALVAVLISFPTLADPVAFALVKQKAPDQLSSLTCPQLMRLERQVFRAGGLCLSGEDKIARVEGIRVRCFVSEERMLSVPVKDYLRSIRKALKDQSCSR